MGDSSEHSSKPSSSPVFRCTSQDPFDSSSTSSLSFFADHSDQSCPSKNPLNYPDSICMPKTSIDEALKSEKAFIEFVTSIPPKASPKQLRQDSTRGKTKATASPSVNKVGLDHLDNLCKLMEQLSELKDTNIKLQKRVQYLEDIKTLHDVHKEICEEGTALLEGPVELQKSATETQFMARGSARYQSRKSRRQQDHSAETRRTRSKSVGHEELADPKSKRIFPKWSKLKEAFGWESERNESMKLKVNSGSSPRRCSDESYRKGTSPTWYLDYPALYSAFGEVQEGTHDERWKRASLTSDKSSLFLETTPEGLRRQKSTPSPGSDRRFLLEATGKCPSSKEQESLTKEGEDLKRGNRSAWGRVKTIIERRRDSLKRKSLRRDAEAEPAKRNEPPPASRIAACPESSPKPSTPQKHKGSKSMLLNVEEDYSSPTTPSLSPTLHRKSRWTRVKKVLKGKKEDDRRDSCSLSTPTSPSNYQQDEQFSFEDGVTQGEQLEHPVSRVGSETLVTLPTPNSDLMLQLQRNLSEDFHRKIREWDRMHSTRDKGSSDGSRKKSDKGLSKSKTVKDISWLEKELQKIEKEKQRLSKERQKYEERAERLEKLKETVLGASHKNEILVRTSAGEFRFEGISDAFTKKLYEWETKKGVCPELSTIALLDSSLQTNIQKAGTFQRVLSRSESSIADIGQPSRNSSNSLQSVKDLEAEKPSRANSEPDLSVLAALNNAVRAPIAEDEFEEEEQAASPKNSEEESRRKDSYYGGLLQENVLLLDQLNRKEEICRSLQDELQVLDEKMDAMSSQHKQETERYRAKLWEVRAQGASPDCVRAVRQLCQRIDTLERATERLRGDRDSLQDSYLFHSKQQENMTLDLLEKMRELQTAESDSKRVGGMDVGTVARLGKLSAILMKQSAELEQALARQSRRIRELQWQLLRRDVTAARLQTQRLPPAQHSRRAAYAHRKARSTESDAVDAVTGPEFSNDFPSEMYCAELPSKEFQAPNLTNTVQQLSKEVLKLVSAADVPLEDNVCGTETAIKKPENSRTIKSYRSSTNQPKKITVRRSSADNLNLASKGEDKYGGASSTSDDSSSDEYYTRVPLRPVLKNGTPPTNEKERLLMSHGEHPPRAYAQKKKKLQKTAKVGICPNRKRSNTFHTNRDLVKPIVYENTPQKCHSFREKRHLEDSIKRNMNELNDMINNLRLTKAPSELPKRESTKIQSNQAVFVHRKSFEKALDYNNRQWLRAVASDSKTQVCEKTSAEDSIGKIVKQNVDDSSSTSEPLQKRRLRKRLKSPESALVLNVPMDTSSANSSEDLLQYPIPSIQTGNTKFADSKPNRSDIPTVTIQLPKKPKSDAHKTEEQTFTLAMPKKRSLSSDQESSSISESSSKEISHSEKSSLPETPVARFFVDTSSQTSPSSKDIISNRNIILAASGSYNSPVDQSESVVSGAIEVPNVRRSKTEKEVTIYSLKLSNTDVSNFFPSSDIKPVATLKGDVKRSYEKSPSAPQLDWMKGCAKKTSPAGAPNVRTLIEKYNQKVIESKSPYSSQVNSPTTPRKVSAPVQGWSKSPDLFPNFCSTPTSPSTSSPAYSPLLPVKCHRQVLLPKSPTSIRNEALQKARIDFIASPPGSPVLPSRFSRTAGLAKSQSAQVVERRESSKDDDVASSSSVDSMSLVMLRAGENCRESRFPKHQRNEEEEEDPKPSKSLSNSSLFRSVLGPEFRLPANFLKLKRSKRKKDMGAVTTLCRQSLLLTAEEPVQVVTSSHKSCPSSPEVKSKKVVKSSSTSWFPKNIFKHV